MKQLLNVLAIACWLILAVLPALADDEPPWLKEDVATSGVLDFEDKGIASFRV